ncbi:MAG: hypothetical protein ACOYU5_06030 [Stygiobacter sp.]
MKRIKPINKTILHDANKKSITIIEKAKPVNVCPIKFHKNKIKLIEINFLISALQNINFKCNCSLIMNHVEKIATR